MHAIVLVQVPCCDAQKIICGTRHQVALEYFIEIAHRPLKPIHGFTALTGQRDFNEDFYRKTKLTRLKSCAVTCNYSGLFQHLDPPMAS